MLKVQRELKADRPHPREILSSRHTDKHLGLIMTHIQTDRQTDRRTLPSTLSPCFAVDKYLVNIEMHYHKKIYFQDVLSGTPRIQSHTIDYSRILLINIQLLSPLRFCDPSKNPDQLSVCKNIVGTKEGVSLCLCEIAIILREI